MAISSLLMHMLGGLTWAVPHCAVFFVSEEQFRTRLPPGALLPLVLSPNLLHTFHMNSSTTASGVQFFTFQLAMMSLAFLLSTAVSKASNGTNLGFVIFIVGWIMQVSTSRSVL